MSCTKTLLSATQRGRRCPNVSILNNSWIYCSPPASTSWCRWFSILSGCSWKMALRDFQMRLKDKVAIVVGAGQTPGDTIGNGRATALLFAREGARVVLVDHNLKSALESDR